MGVAENEKKRRVETIRAEISNFCEIPCRFHEETTGIGCSVMSLLLQDCGHVELEDSTLKLITFINIWTFRKLYSLELYRIFTGTESNEN